MLSAIGRKYACDFDGAPSQGVLRDSLGSFKPAPALQVGETRKVCAYFEHIRCLTTLYVSQVLYIHNISVIDSNRCLHDVGIVKDNGTQNEK